MLDIYDESDIIPKLDIIANDKGLEVFLFVGDELKKYFSNINPEVGVAVMASNEENAKWNLTNMKKLYLVKLGV